MLGPKRCLKASIPAFNLFWVCLRYFASSPETRPIERHHAYRIPCFADQTRFRSRIAKTRIFIRRNHHRFFDADECHLHLALALAIRGVSKIAHMVEDAAAKRRVLLQVRRSDFSLMSGASLAHRTACRDYSAG